MSGSGGSEGSRAGPQQGRALLLLVLSAFLLSGSVGTEPQLGAVPTRLACGEPASGAGSTAIDAVARVDESLAAINPLLSATERARIAAAVVRYSDRYGLEPELVTAVILVESHARPWVHSSKGAVGLMQVMPHMMSPMGLAGNAATIESNVEAGCSILASNIRRLGLERGISAYFWGSDIRGVAYLEKVLEARERVRGLRTS